MGVVTVAYAVTTSRAHRFLEIPEEAVSLFQTDGSTETFDFDKSMELLKFILNESGCWSASALLDYEKHGLRMDTREVGMLWVLVPKTIDKLIFELEKIDVSQIRRDGLERGLSFTKGRELTEQDYEYALSPIGGLIKFLRKASRSENAVVFVTR